MNRHIVNTVVSTAIVLLSTGVAQAHLSAAENRAMDACIQQFIADHPGKVTVHKEDSDPSSLLLGATGYKIEVSATNRTTGKYIGKIVCSVDGHGTVTAEPIDRNML